MPPPTGVFGEGHAVFFLGRLHRFEHRQQAIVTIAFQRRNAVFAQLVAGALDHVVDQLVGQLRCWQVGPRQLQRRTELRHEVPHARITACQGIGEEGAHERPAQPGAKANGVVDFAGGRHAVIDQVQRLAPQRFEQAVGDKTGDFLAHMQRAHTEGFIHLDRGLDRFRRGVLAAHHFHQRQQIDRVERVADDTAFRVSRTLVELARQQPGGTRADQCIGLGRCADLAVQLQFQLQAFRGAFLDEVGVFHAFFNGGHKAQAVLRCAGCEALFFQGAPGIGDAFAQRRFGTRRGVPGDHIEAMRQGAGHPAAADDTAAEGGEGFDFCNKAHGKFLKRSVIPCGRGLAPDYGVSANRSFN